MTVSPVLCIGSALWDVIASASANMRPGYDIAGTIQRRPGGVALNIAVALAAQGVYPELLSTIGDDADGDTLIAGLTGLGVSCKHVLRTPTQLIVIWPLNCLAAMCSAP